MPFNEKHIFICEMCEGEFKTYKTDQRFCTRLCRERHKIKEKNASWGVKKESAYKPNGDIIAYSFFKKGRFNGNKYFRVCRG